MEIISIAQIILSVLLIVFILFQQKSGGGSAIFGSGSGGVSFKKRGPEKFLFYGTIVLSIIFFSLAIVNLII